MGPFCCVLYQFGPRFAAFCINLGAMRAFLRTVAHTFVRRNMENIFLRTVAHTFVHKVALSVRNCAQLCARCRRAHFCAPLRTLPCAKGRENVRCAPLRTLLCAPCVAHAFVRNGARFGVILLRSAIIWGRFAALCINWVPF